MKYTKQHLVALCCLFVIMTSLIMPAHAEVISLKTDKTFYIRGDEITFSGTADKENVGEIVTIVVRDPENNFVFLRQAYVDAEKSFELSMDTKSNFLLHGIYNATAFFTTQSSGKVINFDFSLDGSPVIHPKIQTISDTESEASTIDSKPIEKEDSSLKPTKEKLDADIQVNISYESDGKSITDKIKERIEAAKKLKDAQNAIQTNTNGFEDIDVGLIHENPVAIKDELEIINENDHLLIEKFTLPLDLNSNIFYLLIGAGGSIGAIITIVIVIKSKSRHAKDHVVRTVPYQLHAPSEEDYAFMILKNRLAKGEISIDEFNELKKALKDS